MKQIDVYPTFFVDVDMFL